MKHYSCSRSPQFRRALGPVMIIAAATGFAGVASAMELDTGNPDLSMRWDNTVRYTGGWRMKDQDSRIVNSFVTDESDSKFDKNDMVTNRIDLISEFDFVYQKKHGFRVSGAAWYDEAYQDTQVKQNPALRALTIPSSYNNNEYSAETKRWYKGMSGEFLDAFVFSSLDMGGTPLNLKLGQHTVYWGQAMLYGAGIAYSQAGFDVRKAVANPGSELKELFLPVNQLSIQSQVMPELSIAAQYFFDWNAYRVPEGGTYLSSVDMVMSGPNRTGIPNPVLAAAYLPRADPLLPDHKSGNWGLNVKWSPNFMGGGSIAGTYRELDEKVPWLFLKPDFSGYRAVYPRDTKIYGLTMDFPVGPVSVAGEVSLRKNAALATPAFSPVTDGARGDVWHFAVNGMYLLPKTPVWDTGVLIVEAYGSSLDKITKNEALYQGVGRATCTNPLTGVPGSGNKFDGCGTKSAWGTGIIFQPQWLGVYPGVDLTLPISGTYQVSGNDSDFAGGNEGAFGYSIGLEADVRRTVKVNLSYNGYGGKISREAPGPAGVMWASNNGGNALLRDRGWLALTVKTTF